MIAIVNILIACILTMIIEISVATCFHIKKSDYKYVIIINIITNLTINVIYYFIRQFDVEWLNIISVIVLELLVFYFEGLFFSKKISLKCNSYLFSLCLNLTSFLLGLLI